MDHYSRLFLVGLTCFGIGGFFGWVACRIRYPFFASAEDLRAIKRLKEKLESIDPVR